MKMPKRTKPKDVNFPIDCRKCRLKLENWNDVAKHDEEGCKGDKRYKAIRRTVIPKFDYKYNKFKAIQVYEITRHPITRKQHKKYISPATKEEIILWLREQSEKKNPSRFYKIKKYRDQIEVFLE